MFHGFQRWGGINISILHVGSCSQFSTGSCSPNFDQGGIAPTVSLHCFLFSLCSDGRAPWGQGPLTLTLKDVYKIM